MGRSILHHVARKYGMDEDGVRRRIDEFGVNMASSLKVVAKTMGLFREVRHTGNRNQDGSGRGGSAHTRTKKHQQRIKDRRRASHVLLEHTHGAQKAGRRLQATGTPHDETPTHTLGQHADEAGGLVSSFHNATRSVTRQLRSMDETAMKATLRHMNTLVSPRRAMDVDHLRFDQMKAAFGSPGTSFAMLQAEHGSATSRFYGAVMGINNVRVRFAKAMETHKKRTRARKLEEGRRLSSNPGRAESLYDALDANVETRQRARRQLLAEKEEEEASTVNRVLELPETHALSWIHDLGIDWSHVRSEANQLYTKLRARDAMRAAGASHLERVRAHPTGWTVLDDPVRSRPGVVGDAIRRLQHRIETNGEDPPWHEPRVGKRIHRRLFHVDDADARDDAAHTRGFFHTRRLAEAFLEGTLAAPYTFIDTVLVTGTVNIANEETFWDGLLRYVLASTIGCYLTAPTLERSTTIGDQNDADPLRILRPSSNKLCFPAVPFLLPEIPRFRVLTNTIGVDLYASHPF